MKKNYKMYNLKKYIVTESEDTINLCEVLSFKNSSINPDILKEVKIINLYVSYLKNDSYKIYFFKSPYILNIDYLNKFITYKSDIYDECMNFIKIKEDSYKYNL